MSDLIKLAILELYDEPPEALELQEGSRCLLELFELLIETDQEQKKKEVNR